MRNIILAAFAALTLATAVAPVAEARPYVSSTATYHYGPYDDTGHGPQESGLEGGGN